MSRRITFALVAALMLASLASCDKVPSSAVTKCQLAQPVPGASKTDILFVIDDSSSMATSQQSLRQNFSSFIERLAKAPVALDYQIGVTTTSIDYYFNNAWVTTFPTQTVDCSSTAYGANVPFPAGALVHATGNTDPCSRMQDTTGTPRILLPGTSLPTDFGNNSFVGEVGSGKEQGLEAMRRALTDPLLSGSNAGFVRPGARLAVVIVSDDDDCSDPEHAGTSNEPPGCTSHPVQDYVDFLNGEIGGERRQVTVAVMGAVDANLNPAKCSKVDSSGNPAGTAENPGTRYKQFTDAFGASGIMASICGDFASSLEEIAGAISADQVVPLQSELADWRMLAVTLDKAAGAQVSCSVGIAGGSDNPDVLYTPPSGSNSATLTFTGRACTLEPGDHVDLKVLCAG